MKNHTENTEILEEISKTYVKVTNSMRNNGYADGISDGRDSVFQRDFDRGYADGLKNAFLLGKAHGKFATRPDASREICDELKKPSRGNCRICNEKTLINDEIEKISTIQNEHSKQTDAKIREKYKEID